MRATELDLVFIVPRLHTNMLGWLSGFRKMGANFEVWVRYKGATENYIFCEPTIIGYSLDFIHRKKTFSSLREALALYTMITSRKPQRVVLRLELRVYSFLYLIAAKASRVPIVVYSQWPHSDLKGYRKLLRLFITKTLALKFFTPVYSKNTKWIGEELQSSNDDYLNFIPFAIENTWFSNRLSIPTEQENLRIITVGKFQRRKNHLASISALSTIADKHRARVELTVIGEVSSREHQEVLEELHECTENLNFAKFQLFVNLDHKRVVDLLNASHVFFLLSDNEPASVSNLEAMAAGNYVILKTGGGTGNYVIDQEGGELVSDFECLAHSISNILDKMDKLGLAQQQNRFIAKLICDPVRNAKSILKLFD